MARQPRKSQATRLTADQMRQILDRFGPQMPPAMRQQMQRQIAYSQANPTRATGTPGRGDVPRVTGRGQQQRTAVENKRNYQPPQQQLNQEADQIMAGTPNPQLRAGNTAAYRPEALPAGPRAGFARMAQANQMEAPPASPESTGGVAGGFFDMPSTAPPATGPQSPPGRTPDSAQMQRLMAQALEAPMQYMGTGSYASQLLSGPEGLYPGGASFPSRPADGSTEEAGTGGEAASAASGATQPSSGASPYPGGTAFPSRPPGDSGLFVPTPVPSGPASSPAAGTYPGGASVPMAAPTDPLYPGGADYPASPNQLGELWPGGPTLAGAMSPNRPSVDYPGGTDYPSRPDEQLGNGESFWDGGPTLADAMTGGGQGQVAASYPGGAGFPSRPGSQAPLWPGGPTMDQMAGGPTQTGLGQAVGGQQADTGDAGGADGGEAGSGDGFDAAAAYEAMQQAWNPAQSYARPTAGFVPGSPAPGLGQGTTTGLGPPMGMGGGAGMGGPVAPDQMMSPEQQQAAQQFLQGTFDQFQGAQDAANAANEARYQQGLDLLSGLNAQQNQMLGGLGGLYGQRTNQYAQGAEAAMNRYNDPFSFWTSTSANVGRGYDALNQDVMNRTGLMGATEAENIRQRFGQQQAQAEQDLINRGLGNTTIRPAVQRGINYDQSRAQTGLAEDVANQMNQLDIGTRMPLLQFGAQSSQFGAGLLGNQAQAAERFIGNIANLQGEGLQFGERANQAQQGIGQTTLGWLGSRNDTGPDYNTMAGLASQIAAGGVGWGNIPSLPAPSTPSRPQAPNLPYMPPTQQQRPPSSLTPTTRPQARPAAPGRQQPWATIL